LTQEAIVEAALRVLDAEGLEGLTMRRVGEELNTGPASLYWHVGSKDGLLDLLMDHVIGEQTIPDPDPERWREQLKEVARTMRATILRHRDIIRISIGRVPLGPNALRYSERVLAILRAGGVPDRLAVHGYLLLISVVNGFTIDETGQGGQRPPTSRHPTPWRTRCATTRVAAGGGVPEHGRPGRPVRTGRPGPALRAPPRPLRRRPRPPGRARARLATHQGSSGSSTSRSAAASAAT
jgi:AcrR family transcriptional regulator